MLLYSLRCLLFLCLNFDYNYAFSFSKRMEFVDTAPLVKRDKVLTARDLLETIAPSKNLVNLPPGFPKLESINTDKFSYKTKGNLIRVSANLDKPVVMVKNFIKISNIKMNFTYDKTKPKKAWGVIVKGSLAVGSTILHLSIKPSGSFHAKVTSLGLKDIVGEFLKNTTTDDIGVDMNAITLENVTINGKIQNKQKDVLINFKGTVVLGSLDSFKMVVTVKKRPKFPIEIYSIITFKKEKPEKILKKIMSQKTLNIPFFAHMLASSDLFASEKKMFSVAISYGEVYMYKREDSPGRVIKNVLQSHIPAGVTLLSPLHTSNTRKSELNDVVNTAFVINQPDFDLLIEQNDKMSVKTVLNTVSKEFTAIPTNIIPEFISDLDDAFTTHVSFDSSSSMFSIFVRLQEVTDLVPNIIRINVTNLVLQRNVALDSKKTDWKVSAKGVYQIGKASVHVQYAEISQENGKPYGLTGSVKEISIDDIIEQFDPEFYPSNEAKDMIENTEIESLKIHQVRLFSRVSRKNGTPHILITGFTNLPAFEKDIQIALLLVHKDSEWRCKWATSFKHTPLSNIIQALTGFDSKDLNLLHNSRILTTLISSPLASYSMLPPHIITTPLLRLPVKKALTVIALLRFPDNCGDDKMCTSASKVLDTSKLFTLKGVLSLKEFKLRANILHTLQLSDQIKGRNNTLQFTIGNNSRMDIATSIKLPKTELMFDGAIKIAKNGVMRLELENRNQSWDKPFSLPSLSFQKLKIVTRYQTGSDLHWIRMLGEAKLGLAANPGLLAPAAIEFNPSKPSVSSFNANFSNANLPDIMLAFNIRALLPNILKRSTLPNGLLLSYTGEHTLEPSLTLKGEIFIFDRLLNCEVSIMSYGFIRIITENSPAPVIFAKGQIIIQQDVKTKIRGPKIIADISNIKANVIAKGYAKILGIEDEVEVLLDDKNIIFSVTGKLMDFKETKLTAVSTAGSSDTFQVFGCLADIAKQVQGLLIETISKSANQSIENMEKAEENLVNAQKYFEKADVEEARIRSQRDKARIYYEEKLLDYGRYEVRANDTCLADKCETRCFGCPKLNKCCRLDIFGHCIACSSWKKCCWKNINPLCISKHDGCHVIRTAAEKDLAEKEAQILQHRIVLDNLDQFLSKAEINKGKHQAVLEAALDAKEIVEEDSSPGLNAADAMRSFGSPYGWARINSVCYNTSIEQASTGCMQFHVAVVLFKKPEKNIIIWSCLKEDLVTELTESLANYVFPNIIDTSVDGVTTVAAQMSESENKVLVTQDKLNTKLPQLVDEVKDKTTDLLPIVSPVESTPNLPDDSIEDGDYETGSEPTNDNENLKETNNDLPRLTQLNQTNIPQGVSTLSIQSSQTNAASPQAPDSNAPQTFEFSENIIPPITSVLNNNDGLASTTALPANYNSQQPQPQNISSSKPMIVIDTEPDPEDDDSDTGLSNPSIPSQPAQLPTENINDLSNPNLPQQPEKLPFPNIHPNLNVAPDTTEQGILRPNNQKPQDITSTPNISIHPNLKPPQLNIDNQLLDATQIKDEKLINGPLPPQVIVANLSINGPPVPLQNSSQKTNQSSPIVPLPDYQPPLANIPMVPIIPLPHNAPQVILESPFRVSGFKPYESGSGESGSASADDELKAILEKESDEGNTNKVISETADNAPSNSQNEESSNSSNDDLDETSSGEDEEGSSEKAQNPLKDNSSDELADDLVEEEDHETDSQTTQIGPKKTKQRGKQKDDNLSEVKQNTNLNEEEMEMEEILEFGENSNNFNKTHAFLPNSEYIQPIVAPNYKANKSKTGFTSSMQQPVWQVTPSIETMQRMKRDIEFGTPSMITSSSFTEPNNHALFSNPFWNVKPDRGASLRSFIPVKPQRQMMTNMIRKRWKIPENPSGRCHIFHQLIAICKDMAETVEVLYKSLMSAKRRFREEDKGVYTELYAAESFITMAGKRVNVSETVMVQAGNTLEVVRQGVNIWSKRCTNEFEWQNQSGVQSWLQAMDLRIQKLGGFGVYRFLENLFHAFEALFEALTYTDTSTAKNALTLLQRIRRISTNFDKIFKEKLSVEHSRPYANDILTELEFLKKDSIFCSI